MTATREKQKPVKELTSEELEVERESIETNLALIRSQLQQARSNAATKGEYSDPDWYRRAELALRLVGQRHQSVLRRIKELRVSGNIAKQASRDRQFIAVARQRLTEETYRDIWREVDDMEVLNVAGNL